MPPLDLRPFQVGDLPDLARICLETGDNGRDATPRASHPELLGDYFAVPYAVRQPEACLVLADAVGPCGYVVGTFDTIAWCGWFNREWLPRLRAKYRDVEPRADACDAWLLALLARDAEPPPHTAAFPAHLHIDLLPRAQGGGWGRKLFSAWCELAATHAATGVHLGVSRHNTGAVAFYERMGMTRIGEPEGAWIYGLRFGSRAG
jgi:ribosomal protein S18 acetylase RimI-like enzyme